MQMPDSGRSRPGFGPFAFGERASELDYTFGTVSHIVGHHAVYSLSIGLRTPLPPLFNTCV